MLVIVTLLLFEDVAFVLAIDVSFDVSSFFTVTLSLSEGMEYIFVILSLLDLIAYSTKETHWVELSISL